MEKYFCKYDTFNNNYLHLKLIVLPIGFIVFKQFLMNSKLLPP